MKYKAKYSEEHGFRFGVMNINKDDLSLTEAELNPQLKVKIVS